jgi:hypothetical protein
MLPRKRIRSIESMRVARIELKGKMLMKLKQGLGPAATKAAQALPNFLSGISVAFL